MGRFLRSTGSDTHRAVRQLLEDNAPVHTTDVLMVEVLAGARGGDHRRLRRLLTRCGYLPMGGLASSEADADLYRTYRQAGDTVRTLTDCLIGAVALRDGVAVPHDDRDFDVLARHTALMARRANP
jgi:predicted nucleic acid-binding protein